MGKAVLKGAGGAGVEMIVMAVRADEIAHVNAVLLYNSRHLIDGGRPIKLGEFENGTFAIVVKYPATD